MPDEAWLSRRLSEPRDGRQDSIVRTPMNFGQSSRKFCHFNGRSNANDYHRVFKSLYSLGNRFERKSRMSEFVIIIIIHIIQTLQA
jgi:hypothetical protein